MRGPVIGTAFVHTVIDDYSRVAYAEICADEKAGTAIWVLRRASVWLADRGVVVERVLSDNGSCYRSHAWADACTELGITPKRTRPYWPQTNGKIERFQRTLSDGWAYARFYTSTAQRNQALPGWMHFYNQHRAHSASGGQPPITRLTNLPGHHIQAAAHRRTSLSCSIRRICFFSSRFSAESALVVPGFLPSSTSAWRIQFDKVISWMQKPLAIRASVTPPSRLRATRTT